MTKPDRETVVSPSKTTLMRLARRARGGLIGVSEAATLLNLARLERRGWLKRARRSLYLIPTHRIGLRGVNNR